MTDLQKIILWFAVCLVLAVYVKFSGLTLNKIGQNSPSVLGTEQSKSTYGSFAPIRSHSP